MEKEASAIDPVRVCLLCFFVLFGDEVPPEPRDRQYHGKKHHPLHWSLHTVLLIDDEQFADPKSAVNLFSHILLVIFKSQFRDVIIIHVKVFGHLLNVLEYF